MTLPESSEDFLEHHGVLGMKWGHRKKATGREVWAARRRLSTRQNEYADLADKRKATKKGSPERAAIEKKMAAYNKSFQKDPDRVIAVRLTRGEKAAALLLAGPSGGASLSAILATSALSRRIEQKQDTGQYDKKK